MKQPVFLSSLLLLVFSLLLARAEVNDDSSNSNNDDPILQCGLFMAESSIPGSGWGVYIGKDTLSDDIIYPQDVTVQVSDQRMHMRNRIVAGREKMPRWKLHDYYWSSGMARASHDATLVDSIMPGLGMLANSHTGLVNVDNFGPLRRQGEGNNGAYSHYSEQTFKALNDIPAGHELFAEYGDDWFSDRGEMFGNDIPLSGDYHVADKLVLQYESILTNYSEEDTSYADDLWHIVLEVMRNSAPRVHRALPKSFGGAADDTCPLSGTAYASVPTVVKSLSWLQENGLCLDNIELKQSTIESAGMGAFATRFLPKVRRSIEWQKCFVE
jgi:hypothetical protein